MLNFFDILFGKKDVATLVYTGKSPAVIDTTTLATAKTHAIVGSIETNMHNTKYSDLVAWAKAHEFEIAQTALNDTANMPKHHLMLRPACKGGCFALGPGCFGNMLPGEEVYVLGDTHGDFESMVAILDTILETAKYKGVEEPIVYMLGDILDRNTETCMIESVFILAILQKALPEQFAQYNKIRLGIVKGDHDIGLSYNAMSTTNKFSAAVKPADYCDWLNDRLAKNSYKETYTYIGRAWIRLMAECPSAAFLADSGTLLSPGGVPRVDLQQRMTSGEPYVMQSKEVAQDFEWCRMVDAKNKLLNRSSKTSEVGFQEFESFNALMGGKIRKFIFGHQHPAKGFMRFDKNYAGYDVICISSFRKDDTLGGPTIPYFCKIDKNDVNVYSMCPAKYIIRLEERSTTTPPAAAKPVAPAPTAPVSRPPVATVAKPAAAATYAAGAPGAK